MFGLNLCHSPHPFQDDRKRDEDSCSSYAGAAMNGDGPFLTELFFCLVDLANEVDETLARFRDTLKRKTQERLD